MNAWKFPPLSSDNYMKNNIFVSLLGQGHGSLLYKKLIDEKSLVTDVVCYISDLYDHSVVFIYYQPKNEKDIPLINDIILEQINLIAKDTISDDLYDRAIKRAKMRIIDEEENNDSIARCIGELTLINNDIDAYNKAFSFDKNIIKLYCQACAAGMKNINCVSALIKPLDDSNRDMWVNMQEAKDIRDQKLLDAVERKSLNEKRHDFEYVANVPEPKNIVFPSIKKKQFENGSTMYVVKRNIVDKVELCVDFKSSHIYDPEDKQGLVSFLFDMLKEGTTKYPGITFVETVESLGMDIDFGNGTISLTCLPEDIYKAIDLLHECICCPEFSKKSYSKIYDEYDISIKHFWDDAKSCGRQLIRSVIYKNHPYAKNQIGNEACLKNITYDEIVKAYNLFITPCETAIIICGSVDEDEVITYWEKTFNDFEGEELENPLKELPSELDNVEDLHHELKRDQSVIMMGGLSVARFNEMYDPLLVYDQIFSGGVCGNMGSRLFLLREKTGYFYNIGGSLIAGSGEHPGMFIITAITSPTWIDDAKKMIKEEIKKSAFGIEDDDVEHAKIVLRHSMVDVISTYRGICSAIAFMHKYKLPDDYFNTRVESIKAVTKKDIINAIEAIMNEKNLVVLTVGRKTENK
jgi:zinc protease